MSRAAVVGAGMTKFGVHESPMQELFADAAFEALDDAGIEAGEIEALYFGNAMGGQTENETHLGPKMATHIGMAGTPVQRFEDACATSANAFKNAVQAVEAGVHDAVLVGGVERCTPETGKDTPEMTRIFGSASHRQYEQPSGLTFPGVFALLTKRHMHEHGTTEEQLAHVAVKNHGNGALNPNAHFGKETTVEEALDGPIVADPFRLMDCCPFSDGASAVVVVSDDLADSYDAPVDVTGVGHATDVVPIGDKREIGVTQAARDAAAEAYEQAGIDADAVDFAEVHDCFTGAEILASEALGLIEDGEGGVAAEEGRTARDGDIPINPSGGLKAKGHPIGATGTAQIVELTKHLRGEAGERQLDAADCGVAHNLGGDSATTVVSVMEARQ
ncbi:acetyl-CoA C-acyltransferase [Natronomonas pharaonis DSM 2160]|uniref:Acetyl-CoA C-acyltransferase n=1 Tax=Natronomonas pharaonis (strain ATCC 35678 / DSM 2160 / CIP 103997 / JCM 8858 / NBRC 14720 / NCIMB 2260 / Gabara) TaxID=348780 RepID=A0A1U7EVW3_NATPD|nr:beta-ketoacyl synthase N-terminal-like domain-containing protein [Natronomonas pharaonis]CAI49198.1 acetyl-CoA C-acyltransferase [Natronomonas pharaonis DSM 2160]